jgi:hypothetical protein
METDIGTDRCELNFAVRSIRSGARRSSPMLMRPFLSAALMNGGSLKHPSLPDAALPA